MVFVCSIFALGFLFLAVFLARTVLLVFGKKSERSECESVYVLVMCCLYLFAQALLLLLLGHEEEDTSIAASQAFHHKYQHRETKEIEEEEIYLFVIALEY